MKVHAVRNIQDIAQFIEQLISKTKEYPEDSSDVALLRGDLQEQIALVLLDTVDIAHRAMLQGDGKLLELVSELTYELFTTNQYVYGSYKIGSNYPLLDVYLYVGLCEDGPDDDEFVLNFRDSLKQDIQNARSEVTK